MAQRITETMLQRKIDILNSITESPMETYGEDGGNAGNYHLDYANGGVSVRRMMEKSRHGQGSETIIERGTNREVFAALDAYIDGYRAALYAMGKRL